MVYPSILAPILFNFSINDQSLPQITKRFIYANDLTLAALSDNFQW